MSLGEVFQGRLLELSGILEKTYREYAVCVSLSSHSAIISIAPCPQRGKKSDLCVLMIFFA